MSEVALPMPADHRHLGALERIVFLGLCYLSGFVFWRWGFGLIGPQDPYGAVSLFSGSNPIVSLFAAAALSAILAALATFIQGRRLPLIGPFVAAFGLTILTLRGGTATYLVLDRASALGDSRFGFVVGLLLESLGWFLIIAFVLILSEMLTRRLLGAPATLESVIQPWKSPAVIDRANPVDSRRARANVPAEVPSPTTPANYLLHVGIGAVVGFVAVVVLSAGYRSRGVEHGQACFLAAASMAIATYVAHRVQPIDIWAWSVPSVGLVAVAGYGWTLFTPHDQSNPLPIPGNPFLTVLPMQFIGAGTIGVVLMVWYLSGRSAHEHEHPGH